MECVLNACNKQQYNNKSERAKERVMEEQEGDIEWVLEYLHLEYGEKAGAENALKASDLVYVGEYVIDGIPCQYWSYPTSGEPMWAIIENNAGLRCMGMTATPPPLRRVG